MCGIVGYIGERKARDVLFMGLQKLEYRGYDSAGIALLDEGRVKILRCQGELSELGKILYSDDHEGHAGIGHTRWATHGKPSVKNAHPHRSGFITIVHNGIIENYVELKKSLGKDAEKILSETDTEVLAHLIEKCVREGLSTLKALQKVTHQVRGSYALGVLNEIEPDRVYAAKRGSPLIVAVKDGEGFLASDIQAIMAHTREYFILDDGQTAEVFRGRVRIYDSEGRVVQKEVNRANWTPQDIEKGGYRHFMLKEIFEQPVALVNTLKDRVSPDLKKTEIKELDVLRSELQKCDRFYLVACGTAYHAAVVGRYLIEEIVGIPVEVEIASEFRYRTIIFSANAVAIFVSQSGETADTLAALKMVKARGIPTIAVCNVRDSSIAREADATFYTYAGPEIGVASTKVFVCQMAALYLIMLETGQIRGSLSSSDIEKHIVELVKLPALMTSLLERSGEIQEIARKCRKFKDMLFIGRHINYPIALEAALKLKEISYLHAEGYAAGELKHGPIAIIDDRVLLVAIIQKGELTEKIVSNMLEVKARDAVTMAVTNASTDEFEEELDFLFAIPECPHYLSPFLFVIPLQLFAYFIAEQLGLDIDKPRNLAKSVTVE